MSVRYTGRLIPSGKVFQSNMDDTAAGSVYKFVIGTHTSIPGFDEGLRSFKKGGTGTLYLPAFLAYDAQRGPGGDQFENLIFEVKVVDVTDAPPPSPMQMPTAPKGGQQQPAQAQPQKK
ncbi:FKBP-type peptidyl-prolyl cis-trans isomerase [Puia sp. P3]|uniref:FKBP-type peptidyl-prolyl cis-trans isomerase n=1 Tax=Puia sp. P3 TaxID=3423952 RepID=UPI003D67DE80